ncbi:MAG: cation:proton antiporter [Sphingobacteriaceae bacterium]
MIQLPQLISDLGLILAAAAVVTLIFKKIKQPLVLGYILAGLLVGPHISLIPTVGDERSIQIWAEIGVIILLFTLGLEFSFKKLVKVGPTSSITAMVQIISMIGLGYATGVFLGWSKMDSIFLGAMLSMSSTSIIMRAFEELGIKQKKYAGLVFGALIIEDLVAILLMVLLSTIAVSQQFEGAEMLISVLKLGFFLILWFIGGIFLVPTFLKRTRKLMNDETMLIVSLALCLLMVMLATQVGFSPALGAFIMGSILAETTQAERIEHLTKSVKNLFAAIFFVSVGMMIDPAVLVEYAWPVVLIALVTAFGKLLSTTLGALLSGQPLKISVQAGMSISQIGEFSFIIATLGLTLKVTSDFLYPIAVAVSAITTFSTPYMIRSSESLYQFLEKHIPESWLAGLNRYSSSTQTITTLSDWKALLQSYIYKIIIHSVILIGIIFLSSRFLHPFIVQNIVNGNKGTILTIVVSILFMSPFLWALSIRRTQKKAYSNLWLNRKYSRGPLVAIEAFRIALSVFYVGSLLNIFLDTWLAIGIAIAVVMLIIAIFSRKLQQFYTRLEQRFLINLNEREILTARPEIVPWDAHLADLEVSSESPFIGKTLIELGIREKYGVNIALIERGRITIPTPGPRERLFPGDKLTVIGTDEQLANVQQQIEDAKNAYNDTFNEEMQSAKNDLQLQKITVTNKSKICGNSIRTSGIRENTQGLVVGVERQGERILNPDSNLVFEAYDIVWIVGNSKRIRELV